MSTVRTWADGFGRWYAEVPYKVDAAQAAREAIEHELDIRGERGPEHVVRLEFWESGSAEDDSPLCTYREAWDQ